MKKIMYILKRGVIPAALFAMMMPMTVFAAEEEVVRPAMYATFWALIPPVVAIGLALITKEVYSSLFIGILMGGLFYSGFQPEQTIIHIFKDGMIGVLADSYNVGILIFLVILGAIVCLMNKAGGSSAFGKMAGQKIKTRTGAQLATAALGVLIFVDDYFNCLTVGSVMKPVTDKHKISREKLAYIIDSTAAPICIIAPISSWAAAVTGFVEGEDGLALFVRAIPYNFYAILTICMVVAISIMNVDFGLMKNKEEIAAAADAVEVEEIKVNVKGRVIDLIVPIVTLIAACIIGIIYTGGFFAGTGFVEAFSNSDAPLGLVLGSAVALIITIIFYLVRRNLTLHDSMECIPEGFKAMVPAIMILTFAWTLKAMTDSLGAAVFVEGLMKNSAKGLLSLLPAIIFAVACLLAFATGTSWGTFGILIPIVVEAFSVTDPELMIISISACMAGAVCGDHCSPISDTTIMASAGAQCNHVDHVSTQLPYALLVAAVSFVTYIMAGYVRSALICLPVGIVLLLLILFLIRKKNSQKI